MPATPDEAAPTGQDARQPEGAPQQAPTGGPDGPETGPADTVSRAGLTQLITERQAAEERARQAEAKLQELQEKLAGVPDTETLKAFTAWQADQANRAGAAGEDGGRARPRELTELRDRNDALKAQLTDLLCDSALQAAAAPVAHNPSQVVALLRHRVRMAETPDGRFAPEFLDASGRPLLDGAGGAVGDAETFVRLFLSLPENANLVRAAGRPGSGARLPGGPVPSPEGRIPATMAEFLALSPAQRLRAAGAMTPRQRRELIGIAAAGAEGFL